MQRFSLDTCFIQLARSARGRGEAFDLIALLFSSIADDCERGGLTRAGEALDSLDTIRRAEHILDHGPLCPVEMRVLVGNGDGLRTRKNRFTLVLSFLHSVDNLTFRFDGLGGGELTAWNALKPFDNLKFPGS